MTSPLAGNLIVDCLQYSKPSRERFIEWREGKIDCVHVTIAVWENARETLSVLGRWNDLFDRHRDLVALAGSQAEIQQVAESGRTAVVFGFQNTAPFEDDIRLVRIFRDLGVRIVQLTYNTQNSIASGCWDESDSGLSNHVGRQFIKEFNDADMMIDLSHCSERTCLETIELSSSPVAITHANPLEFVGPSVELNRRPKSTTVLRELANAGGVVGLSLYVRMLKNGIATSEQEFVEMIAWSVERFGIDHVGLGTDFYTGYNHDAIRWWRMGRWGRESPVVDESRPVVEWPAWFPSPAAFPRLVDAMRRHGFTDDEVDRILGGNWMRIFGAVFGGGRRST